MLLDSSLRPPDSHGPDALPRTAAACGAEGVALGSGCALRDLSRLGESLIRAGLRPAVLRLPMVEMPLSAGRRLPDLGAPDDREERLAAVALGERGLRAARDLGASHVVLTLGRVALHVDRAAIECAFARRELDEGEPGAALFAAACAERKARSAALLDACRFSLERLSRGAERAGLVLALGIARAPWEVPTPREAGELVRDLRGAPLGVALDPAARSVLETLGLPVPDIRWKALAADAVLADIADSVGLDGDVLPGLGETDVRAALEGAPPDLPRVVRGAADSTDAEIVRALAIA